MTNTENLENTGLLARQWAGYGDAHEDRRNLFIHLATVPVFMAGTIAVVAAPFVSGWLALAGIGGMLLAMGAQGKGHALEHAKPAPFRSRLDFVARIFAEQWITFPRFVLSGGVARALRAR
jgi:hypothetical protein